MTDPQNGIEQAKEVRPPEAAPGANRTLAKPDGEAAAREEIKVAEQAISRLPLLPGVGLDIMTLGRLLTQSGFFKDIKAASQAVVKVIKGQALGIDPISAMTEIHVVEGKVGLSAALMASLIQRSGRFSYLVSKLTDTAAAITFFELTPAKAWKEIGRSRFTSDDAARAGLLKRNPTYQFYPRNMLFARAMSNGARWFCPGVFGGPVYTPEELREEAEGPVALIVGGMPEAEPAAPPPADKASRLAGQARARAAAMPPAAGREAVPSVPRKRRAKKAEEAPAKIAEPAAPVPEVPAEPIPATPWIEGARQRIGAADQAEGVYRDLIAEGVVLLGWPGMQINERLEAIAGRPYGEWGPDDYEKVVEKIGALLEEKT